ncbi:hypothetical protein [Metabacillus arenae]|uniref:Uncharacterized protein n=1 Tax=Metabacillus arenae TaxID=2771434 RepID=A0A926RV07_9BACI|nr:hypothetical protein [Metabacillus arenae]MBD1379158.1 hypothetical protein [Metabacillus arenae]
MKELIVKNEFSYIEDNREWFVKKGSKVQILEEHENHQVLRMPEGHELSVGWWDCGEETLFEYENDNEKDDYHENIDDFKTLPEAIAYYARLVNENFNSNKHTKQELLKVKKQLGDRIKKEYIENK